MRLCVMRLEALNKNMWRRRPELCVCAPYYAAIKLCSKLFIVAPAINAGSTASPELLHRNMVPRCCNEVNIASKCLNQLILAVKNSNVIRQFPETRGRGHFAWNPSRWQLFTRLCTFWLCIWVAALKEWIAKGWWRHPTAAFEEATVCKRCWFFFAARTI